jgi:hypothetical protein
MRSPSSRKRLIRILRTVTTATTVRAAGPPADRRNDARSYSAGAADHQAVVHLLIAHRGGSLFQGRWSLPPPPRLRVALWIRAKSSCWEKTESIDAPSYCILPSAGSSGRQIAPATSPNPSYNMVGSLGDISALPANAQCGPHRLYCCARLGGFWRDDAETQFPAKLHYP